MKKLSRLLVSVILVITMLLGVACTSSDNGNPIIEGTNPKKVDKITFTGTHIMTAEEVEGEDYIVRNGNFEYQIMIPDAPTQYETLALDEFKLLLKRALGNVAVSVVSDQAVTNFDENVKYISIGDTKLLELAEVEVDKNQLGYNGVRIVTVGKAIFIAGGDLYGVVNAVYDFFQICFNYEIYAKNCIEIDTGVKNLKLKNFDVTDIPDIAQNSWTHGPLQSFKTASEADYRAMLTGDMTRGEVNTEISRANIRMRSETDTNQGMIHMVFGNFGSDTVGTSHASMLLWSDYYQNMEGNENITISPDWYAASGIQVCWTAHGNEQALEDMKNWAVNACIYMLKKNPKSANPACDYLSMCNWDGGGYCECEVCAKSRADYGGAYSASNIIFINDVIERIEAKMAEEPDADWVRPNFKILMFAYDGTIKAPAYYDDEAGKYVTYNGLVADDRICVWNTTYPLAWAATYDEDQASKLENIVAWGDVVKHQWSWNYSHHYASGAFFLDNINGYNSDRFQHMAALGFAHNFTEIHTGQEVLTTWFNYTTYVISKLYWNSNLNEYELAQKFFNAYYGPAGETMLNLYFRQKTYCQHMYEQHEARTGTLVANGFDMWDSSHYPYDILKGWIQQIDKALLDIEVYKSIDMDTYQVYKDRIDIEGIQYFYVIWRIYANYGQPPYTIAEKEEYKDRFIRILESYKITWASTASIRAW